MRKWCWSCWWQRIRGSGGVVDDGGGGGGGSGGSAGAVSAGAGGAGVFSCRGISCGCGFCSHRRVVLVFRAMLYQRSSLLRQQSKSENTRAAWTMEVPEA